MGELSENFVDLTKYICEKIEKAVGFVFDPYGSKMESRKQLISRIKSQNLPPLEEAALISKVNKVIKEYVNQNDILQIALEDLNFQQKLETPKLDSVDDEFLSRFFESAKHVSNEDFKLIWGHILANKLKNPNSVSKRLIQILSIIEPYEAEIFTEICKYSLLCSGEPILFIDENDSHPYWVRKNISLDHLLNLQSIGLIVISSYNYSIRENDYTGIPLDFQYEFVYSNYKINVALEKDKVSEEKIFDITCGNVAFTKAGVELFKVINTEYSDDALTHIMEYIRKQGLSVLKYRFKYTDEMK